MRTLLLVVFLLLSATFEASAQCQGPGREPSSGQAVCGYLTFHETDVSNCTGPDLPNPSSGCGQVTSDNSRWYKFHCYTAGAFGFMLVPNSPLDDYDWEIMDVTGHLPGDVYTMELRVSLNLSGQTGKTGCTPSGTSDINCGGGAPGTQFNKMLNLVAGHDYLMMVNNWSASGQPYDINFSGTAVLTNNAAPTITNVGIVGCDASKLKVTFSEDILCDSTTVTGSEFTITAGTNVITGIASDCSLGANGVPYLIINLQAPIPAGNYQLNVNIGTDGNTLENVCLIPMLPVSIPFTVAPIIPVTINPVTYTGCAPTILNVPFSKPVWCNSVTQSGSGTEISILPGNPAISIVQSTCTFGAQYTDLLQVVLQNPLPPGNYQLMVNNGTDGNTFIDTCSNTIAVGTSFPFTIAATSTPPIIQSIGFDPCHRDKIIVNFDKPVSCATISAAGTELALSPAFLVNSITYNCTAGSYTSQITMNLSGPLPTGNYNIVVNNGADGNTLSDTCFVFIPIGYSKSFGSSAPPPPLIQSFSYDNCKRDKLVVHFDKPILCSTLAVDGSDFTIPGGPAITGIISDCATNPYVNEVTLLLQNQMPPNQFVNIMVRVGTDGNTISDTCFSFITAFYTAAYQAPVLPPPPLIDSVQFDKCSPTTMKIFYNHPIVCSSILPSGLQFLVNGPSLQTIVSATGDPATCALGYTNTVLLQLAAPITTGGNYAVGTWNFGSTIFDTCRIPPPVGGSAIQVFIPGTASAVFNSQVNWGCVNDTIVLSHPGGNGVNSWIWNFSDGTSASGQTISKIFPVATPTVGVQLIVSNGSCSDTSTGTITLDNALQAAFANIPADTFCINTPANFINTSSGAIINYLWDFGDLTQFNGQSPPTHIYTLSNIYNVQLIVTDNHGCKDTASKSLHVNTTAYIDFTGLRPQYCTGNQVVLTRKIANTIDSYVWDNGDGKTFTNVADVNFSYANEGVYTITLTGNDKYCGVSTVSKTVPVYAVPKINLGSDTVLCQSDRILIGVPAAGSYTYLWSTGATTSQIYTDIFTRDYNLTADNHGCKGYDAMSVKVLSACLIKVPGAFTPNGDGLNDVLKALNADLAKNFSFKVFNRMGQLLFSTNNPLEGWDGYFKGKAAETGAYIWTLSYTDPWTGNPVREKGSSILLH